MHPPRLAILLVTLLVAVFAVALLPVVAGAKRPAKDWTRIDFDKLEEDWEEGDDEDILMTEGERLFQQTEKRRNQAMKEPLDAKKLSKMSPSEVRLHMASKKDQSGPLIIFLTLSTKVPGRGDEDWSEDTRELFARVVTERAFVGGLDIKPHVTDPSHLLITSQRGWDGEAIVRFLVSLKEVQKVTWNNEDFTARDVGIDDEDVQSALDVRIGGEGGQGSVAQLDL